MSKAARKARKQEQRETGTKYQHPSREGIPYGHSKPWSIDREIADMHRQMDTTRDMLAYASAWHEQPGGFR